MKTFVSALLLSSVSANASYTTVDNGPTWSISYSNSKFNFVIENVASNSEFILAFGNDAANTQTDIVSFQALGNGVLTDKFGTFSSASTTGDTNSWTNVGVTTNNNMYKWTASRAASATTASKDVSFNCGTSQQFMWKTTNPSTSTGSWTL